MFKSKNRRIENLEKLIGFKNDELQSCYVCLNNLNEDISVGMEKVRSGYIKEISFLRLKIESLEKELQAERHDQDIAIADINQSVALADIERDTIIARDVEKGIKEAKSALKSEYQEKFTRLEAEAKKATAESLSNKGLYEGALMTVINLEKQVASLFTVIENAQKGLPTVAINGDLSPKVITVPGTVFGTPSKK